MVPPGPAGASAGASASAGTITAVLVHGSGHTAAVWAAMQAAMRFPSIAVNLPGRADRPAAIAEVTVEQAAASVVADAQAAAPGDGPLVLVAHSVAGVILPSIAAGLGSRVRHLVFVAGITAPDGELPMKAFLAGREDGVAKRLAKMRTAHAGRSLEEIEDDLAHGIDSLNFSSQPMRWAGVPTSLPRTWIRCTRDPIQPPALQQMFIANSGADEVLDIDTRHTPALDDPVALAALLDAILERASAAEPSSTT